MVSLNSLIFLTKPEQILMYLSTKFPESYHFSLIPWLILSFKLSLSLILIIIIISLAISLLLLCPTSASLRCQSSPLKSPCTSCYVSPLINLPISLRMKAKSFLLTLKALYHQVPPVYFPVTVLGWSILGWSYHSGLFPLLYFLSWIIWPQIIQRLTPPSPLCLCLNTFSVVML